MTMKTSFYLVIILINYCKIIISLSQTTNSSEDIILKRYNETGQFPSVAELLGKQIESLLKWKTTFNSSLSLWPEDPFLSPEYVKLTDDLKRREEEAYSEHTKCVKSITTINGGKNPCKGELLFEDDFNLPNLNSSKWNIETRFSTEPDYEFVLYMNLTKNIFIRKGKLTIKPIRLDKIYGSDIINLGTLSLGTKCTGELGTNECVKKTNVTILPPIISGRINTNNRFKFKYGRIEIRARLSVDAWIYPLILLEPAIKLYGQTRLESGQVRLAYANIGGVFNNNPNNTNSNVSVSGGILLGVEEPFRSMKMCNFTTISKKIASSPSNRWTNKFHNFTMEWLPDGFTFYINGHQYCHIDPGEYGFHSIKSLNGELNPTGQMWRNHNRMAPYDREFFLTFGVGIGGFNDFPDNEHKPWRNYAIQAMRTFWDAMKPIKNWPSNRSMLKVDFVRIYAL